MDRLTSPGGDLPAFARCGNDACLADRAVLHFSESNIEAGDGCRDHEQRANDDSEGVLVRCLAQDDPVQSPLATQLIEQHLSEREPGFVSVVAMAEAVSVLER